MNCKQVEKIIGYAFCNPKLLENAITHPGLFRHPGRVRSTFEKLEFLGDRVLGLCLAAILYKHFRGETEGNLATRIAHLASTVSLIQVAKNTGLIDHFGLAKDDVRNEASSIADMVESLLAAVFLDSNLETAMQVVKRVFGNMINQDVNKRKDSKSSLQEYSQKNKLGLPVYMFIEQDGDQRSAVFKIKVSVGNNSEIGIGKNKKEAEQHAAEKLLLELNNGKKM